MGFVESGTPEVAWVESVSITVRGRSDRYTKLENDVFENPSMSKEDLMVYLALSYHSNREGKCFPSLKTLCRESRSSKPTVLRSITRLNNMGEIIIIRRKSQKGGYTSNLYVISRKAGGGSQSGYQPGSGTVPACSQREYLEPSSSEQCQTKKSFSSSPHLKFLEQLSLPFRLAANKTTKAMLRGLEGRGLLDPDYFEFVAEREKLAGYFITSMNTDEYLEDWRASVHAERTRCPECGQTDNLHITSCSILQAMKLRAAEAR
jgi:GntR family transcriptional regulator